VITSPSITIKNAYLSYDGVVLFQNLNMTLAAGKWSCLLGPSGVGKSTLLRLIAHLIPNSIHTHAEIRYTPSLTHEDNIAYMAQTDLLLPWLTALENVLLSARLKKKVSKEITDKAVELLIKVGLKEAIHKYPEALSGGMRQRVALVRTLLQDKPIVLMDEPFSALDAITRFELQTLAATLLKNKTVLLVTHDPIEALRLANDIYILSGRPATLSSPMQLSTAIPRDPADTELIAHQADLYHALITAKEVSA
jgi:putative hydroxymethylpyrimidine transport system ATP-binding protein